MVEKAIAKRSGTERAAILLLTLGEQAAAEILKHMGAKDVQRLGGAMASMTSVSRREVSEVLTDFSSGNAFVSTLGNVAGNQPRFQLIGLGPNATLFSYDLLKLSQSTPQALVEGVVDMRVLYGVDTVRTGLRQVTAWIAPTASGYTAAQLTNGTNAAQTNLQAILAVRVGLVLRSELIEKDDVTAGKLILFSDLDSSVHHTYTLPTDGVRQRYRTVEFTVPLRNVRFSR